MATEVTGKLRAKDGSGNEYILYPKTKTECVIGLDSYVTGSANESLSGLYTSMGYGHLVITVKWPEGTYATGLYVKGITSEPVALSSNGKIDMWVEAKTYSLQVCESDGTYTWLDVSFSSKSATVTVGNTTNVTITGTALVSDGGKKTYYSSTTIKLSPRIKWFYVSMVGGGSGGWGSTAPEMSSHVGGNGGGGGGYAYNSKVLTSSINRKSISVVVGAGGAGGAYGLYTNSSSGPVFQHGNLSGEKGGDSSCAGVTAYGGARGTSGPASGGSYNSSGATGGHNGGSGSYNSGTTGGNGGTNGYTLYDSYSWSYGDGGDGGNYKGNGYAGKGGAVWFTFHTT